MLALHTAFLLRIGIMETLSFMQVLQIHVHGAAAAALWRRFRCPVTTVASAVTSRDQSKGPVVR